MAIPILGDIFSTIGDIVGKAVVDKDKKIQIEAELKKLEDKANERVYDQAMAQLEINKTEAAHSSVFVAGWRPFIGWAGGAGLAAQSILLPIVEAFGGRHVDLNVELLVLTLSTILGIGGLRTFEKVKGVPDSTPMSGPATVQTKTVVFGPRKEIVQPLPTEPVEH